METTNSQPQGEEQPPKKAAAPAPISLDESRALAPVDSQELRRVIAYVNDGGGFPARFDTEAKRIAAYNMANSLMGSKWQLAINNIANIKGQLSIYGELPGALAEQTKEVAEKRCYVIDPNYKEISVENKNLEAPLYSGVCEIQRKGRAKKTYHYTIEEAKNAGQYPATKKDGSPSPDSPWNKFTRIMLMRKAMAIAIKMEFADAMVGVPVAEYDFDEMPDKVAVRDVTPGRDDRTSELNNRFKRADQPIDVKAQAL